MVMHRKYGAPPVAEHPTPGQALLIVWRAVPSLFMIATRLTRLALEPLSATYAMRASNPAERPAPPDVRGQIREKGHFFFAGGRSAVGAAIGKRLARRADDAAIEQRDFHVFKGAHARKQVEALKHESNFAVSDAG